MRGSVRLHFRGFVSGQQLMKSNAPQFDEAELLAPELESKPYKAKKSLMDYEWPDKSPEELEKENQDKTEKLMKLSAILQGLLVLAGVGIGATVYSKWPQIKGWWMTKDMRVDDDTIEKLFKKKAKKSLADIPIIPTTELGFEVPGLYFWGGDGEGLKKSRPGSVFPRRNSLFDGKYLRDVCLTTVNNVQANLAIDEKGNLLKWDNNKCECILADQNLVSVKESNSCAYALNKRGEILIVPLNSGDVRLAHIDMKRSWLLPWRRYTNYGFKLDTKSVFKGSGEKKVRDFDVGKEHLVLISNAGKAYSCATGVKASEGQRPCGQFGVPTLSHFDKFPPPNKLYEIELLNNGLTEDKKVEKRKIEQIACGNFHTLARDSNGNLFVFGLNRYGQLGLPILYDIDQAPYPKVLNRFNSYFSRDIDVKCVDVHCSGDTSYVTMTANNLGDRTTQLPAESISYFAFGSGQYGELGNGNFRNSQSEPTPLKDLPASNKIEEWACGEKHVLCKLHNGDVCAWGLNDHGQLGTGKRIKHGRPVSIPEALTPGAKNSPEELFKTKLKLLPGQYLAAGGDSSCIYWKK